MHPFIEVNRRFKRIIRASERAMGLDRGMQNGRDAEIKGNACWINQFFDLRDNSVAISAVFSADDDLDETHSDKVVVVFGFSNGINDDATITLTCAVGFDSWEIVYEINHQHGRGARRAKIVADWLKIQPSTVTQSYCGNRRAYTVMATIAEFLLRTTAKKPLRRRSLAEKKRAA